MKKEVHSRIWIVCKRKTKSNRLHKSGNLGKVPLSVNKTEFNKALSEKFSKHVSIERSD
jgi:hypothetical protein